MALLPPEHLNAVVSVEERAGKGFRHIATGFLVSFQAGGGVWKGKDPYRIFLVTNRRVFEKRKRVDLRFDTAQREPKRIQVDLVDKKGKKNWFEHHEAKVDIAVIPVDVSGIGKENIGEHTFLEEGMAFKEDIRRFGITHGDEVYVLGFPTGLAGKGKDYAIVRSGIIARLDDEILDKESSYLIDSYVSAGSSGGPVVLKPVYYSIRGTKAVNSAFLMGVVSSYIPHEKVAISRKARQPKTVLTENSGFAWVLPMDFVRDIVRSTWHVARDT